MWISIKERLPSETEDYLVVLDNEYIDIRFFNSKTDRRVTYYSMLNKFLFLDNKGDWHTEDRVTHWMPLPELPSGAENEEQNDDGYKITCKDCKHLTFSDCYGECNKALRIVHPDETCSYAERKEQNNDKR